MQPVAQDDAKYGWSLLLFLGALGQMYQLADELAHYEPTWGCLLDIDDIPDVGLPWLAQFFGTVFVGGETPLQQRTIIREHKNWERGTPTALKNECRQYLTGTQTVLLIERDTDPYHFTVNTYAAETTTGSTYAIILANYATYLVVYNTFGTYADLLGVSGADQVTAAILRQKPAGLQYTYTVLAGSPSTSQTYANVMNDFSGYDDVMDERQTYDTLVNNP
jgi:hypothetical protein